MNCFTILVDSLSENNSLTKNSTTLDHFSHLGSILFIRATREARHGVDRYSLFNSDEKDFSYVTCSFGDYKDECFKDRNPL